MTSMPRSPKSPLISDSNDLLQTAARYGQTLLEENENLKLKISTLQDQLNLNSCNLCSSLGEKNTKNERKISSLMEALRDYELQIQKMNLEKEKVASNISLRRKTELEDIKEERGKNDRINQFKLQIKSLESRNIKLETDLTISQNKNGKLSKEMEILRNEITFYEKELNEFKQKEDIRIIEDEKRTLSYTTKLETLLNKIDLLESQVWEGERMKEMLINLNHANKDLHKENEEIRHCLSNSNVEREKLKSILDSSEKQTFNSPQLFTPPCLNHATEQFYSTKSTSISSSSLGDSITNHSSKNKFQEGKPFKEMEEKGKKKEEVAKSLFDEITLAQQQQQNIKEEEEDEERLFASPRKKNHKICKLETIDDTDPLYIHFRLCAAATKINLQLALAEYDPFSSSSISVTFLFTQAFKEGVPFHEWNAWLKGIYMNQFLEANRI